MRLELHCHSTHSDGSLSAGEVAAMGAQFGVRLFCLTDHDTWGGHAETVAALAGTGCHVLRSAELTCKAYGRTVHLLVYGLQDGPGLAALASRLEWIQSERRARIYRICDRLAALGHTLDPDAILAKCVGKTPGRPDVARALVEAKICTSPKEAFDRFLQDGGPADVDVERLSIEEALALSRGAGARISLAHPHTLGDYARVRDLFVRHRAAGLEGIEAYYGKYAQAESHAWLRLAKEQDLVPTGGSDFHGDMSPTVTRPGIELPDPVAARIHEWLGLSTRASA